MIPVRSRAVLHLSLIFFLFVSATAIAQNTIHVPADQPTIQSGINAASPGDTVLVAPGTYVENINFNGKAIAVTSSDGAATTIIDGGRVDTVVTFNHNEPAAATLNGFTIRNGNALGGAGIQISGSSPTITNNVITANMGSSGTGIAVNNGSATIKGNTITANVQRMPYAACGGAIYISAYPQASYTTNILSNVITQNHFDLKDGTASSYGGGICMDGYASALIQNNYISGNSANRDGGGIYASSSAPVTIVGNTISNNSSGDEGDGGGFFDDNYGPLLFLNNTLYGNSSVTGTSEIAMFRYNPRLNSIFKNNIVYATSGQAINCAPQNALTVSSNIVYSVSPATNGNCLAFGASSGTIFAEPGMVNPAAGDFHLHDGSPAIDAGTPDSNLPPTDQGGTTRVRDGNNDGTAVVDIGAYEFIAGGTPAGWAVLAPVGATFPATTPGSSSDPINFTLLNNGSAALTINSISVNSSFAQSNNCPLVLAVNATCLIQVTFAPTALGNFSGILSVAADGANGTITVPLSGIGPGTIHVPADQQTIQAAINAAAPGDTVLVAPGTYFENINFNGKAITVTSSDGSASTIIDGSAAGTVVTFNHNETTDAVLNGFTLRNGNGFFGGGIYMFGASATITNNVITNNVAASGLAIEINTGSPTIQGNTITNNVQNVGYGGAGGAIDMQNGSGLTTTKIIGNRIINNHLDLSGNGGGITLNTYGVGPYGLDVLIQNNYISGNSAANQGGGVWAGTQGTVKMIGNVIANNSTSNGSGLGVGGFYNVNDGPLLFLNNTVYGNTSAVPYADFQIATSIFAGPSAFKNNIVYSPSGIAISCPTTGPLVTATNNIIYSVRPPTNGDCPAVSAGNGNILDDPGMVDPASGDFHLRSASPAIDAGAADPDLPTTDQDGNARIIDGNNDGTPVVDIGAYEFPPGAPAGWGVLMPHSVTFPSIDVGSSSAPVTFSLINRGNAELSINSITVSGPFAQTNNCPSTLPAGYACSVSITFSPTAGGDASGMLSIVTNAGTATAPLKGVGVAWPGATFSATTIDFGSLQVGSSIQRNLSVTSTGSAPLTIFGISIDGPPFSIAANDCPGSLPPGASCTVTVSFSPTTRGDVTGHLDISQSAGITGATIFPLTGTCTGIGSITIHVPADQPSIQAAINAAASGDTVLVAPGTYVENINFNGKAITVTSSDGAATTIIDGNAAGSVVTFNQNESAGAVLNGFTVRNGQSSFGAGIYVANASPTITNNVVRANGGVEGIGIGVIDGSPLIQGNTITGNVAGSRGGLGAGIRIQGSSGVTSNTSVIGNLITNNHADASGAGGGIFVDRYAAALIQNNYISGNSAYGGGGGIYANSYGQVTAIGNVITKNSAGAGGDGGGGFYDGNYGPLSFLNNTLYANNSVNGTSEVVISSSFAYPYAYPLVVNNIFYATSGNAATCSTSIPVGADNIVYALEPAKPGNCASLTPGGYLIEEPGMVNPAQGDFHLHVGSPAIDAGSTPDFNLPTTDQDGNMRVLDGNNDGTAVVDIGAFEFPSGVAPAGWALLSPDSATFKTILVGTSSAGPLTFLLVNSGNADLSINSISVSGPFAQTNNCPTTLAVLATCSIQTTFHPTVIGLASGTLSVVTDDGKRTVTSILHGTAVGTPVAVLSPNPLAFDPTVVGSTVTRVATLTNSGTGPLFITNIFVSAIDFYKIGTTCARQLDAGSSCTITVSYAPSTRGAASGSLSVQHDAADGVSTISLVGTGIAPIASMSPSSLSFGPQLVGTISTAQPVTLSNTGDAPLSIASILTIGRFGQTNNCAASLAPGASCTINVRFGPLARGTVAGNLTVNVGTPTSQTISLSGTGIAPVASVSSPGLAFGSQLVGSTSAAQPVTLSNTGEAPLTGISIGATAPFAQTNNCGTALAPGASCTINVSFSPFFYGGAFDNLRINVDIPATNPTVSLSGTGVVPSASVSPSGLTFGTQSVGTTSAAQTITLSNTGDSAFSITSISATAPFAQTNNCGGSLAPGASCTVNVTFSPTARGTASGTVAVNVNASASYQTVSLSGTGVAPVASISPANLAFGSQLLGTTTAAQVVTLANSGDAPLSISSIVTSAPFSQTNNCSTSLAPGASCTINATFNPTSRGTASGNLTVNVGAPASNQTISLSGTGIAPVASISPTNLAFGSQLVGTTTAAQPVTLSNTGDAALSITSIVTSAPFAQTNNCSTSLAAGASCTINVTFSPTARGTASGSLTVNVGQPAANQTVSLSGTGVAPVASISSSSIAFGSQLVNTTSAAQPVTLSNTGDAPLSINSITNSAPFTQLNNCSASLAPGASCTISVAFAPVARGPWSGSVAISVGAPASNQTILLSGTGIAPIASVSPASLTFGSQAVGTTSAAQTVTLSNTGDAPISTISIATSAPFSKTNCSTPIAPGASCSINVTFSPSTAGSFSGSLTITSDGSSSPIAVSLAGTGVVISGGPTVHLDFNYPDRNALLNAGWSFIGTTASGGPRNTEQTGDLAISYDQATHPGAIRIPVGSGELWQNSNNSQNMLLLPLPSTWTSIRLKIAAFNPFNRDQEAGLAVYQDDDNYVLLNRIFGSQNSVVEIFREVAQSASAMVRKPITNAGNLILRIDRSGNKYTGLYSTDGGSTWITVSSVNTSLTNPKLGIQVGGDMSGAGIKADLAWIEYVTQ